MTLAQVSHFPPSTSRLHSTAMRLLNTTTGEFYRCDDPTTIRYAILSHVWLKDGEELYQDLLKIQDDIQAKRVLEGEAQPDDAVLTRASAKVREACAYARAHGFEYIWIDSCCIDKTSSAELSEAINSMYLWYSLSSVCYAYLDDVSPDEDAHTVNSSFRGSRWFTRGWTLQELITPRVVVFLSSTWQYFGTKADLGEVIVEVTGIDIGVLTHVVPLNSVTIARRMSWASRRVTTRKEDEAYSLMGLFGVNMPAIYGEGGLAFGRLQEEILKQYSDQTIFLWTPTASLPDFRSGSTLLAPSPAAFVNSGSARALGWEDLAVRLKLRTTVPSSYLPTSLGLRCTFPMISVGPSIRLAVLACADDREHLLALVLRKHSEGEGYSVGTTEWNALRARYRSTLVCLPWTTGSAERGVEPELSNLGNITRIVRLPRSYPVHIPVCESVIAHRPYLASPPLLDTHGDDILLTMVPSQEPEVGVRASPRRSRFQSIRRVMFSLGDDFVFVVLLLLLCIIISVIIVFGAKLLGFVIGWVSRN